jgi:hypothetical protein
MDIFSEKTLSTKIKKQKVYDDFKHQYLEYSEVKDKEREDKKRIEEAKFEKEWKELYTRRDKAFGREWNNAMKNSTMTRLEVKVQQLGERLAKLERHTQD